MPESPTFICSNKTSSEHSSSSSSRFLTYRKDVVSVWNDWINPRTVATEQVLSQHELNKVTQRERKTLPAMKYRGGSVLLLFCWRDWCISHSRHCHEETPLYKPIEALFKAARKLKLGWKWVLTWPQTHHQVTNWMYWSGSLQNPDLNPMVNFKAAPKRHVWARRPTNWTNMTQFHQFCLEEWTKHEAKYCDKLVEIWHLFWTKWNSCQNLNKRI